MGQSNRDLKRFVNDFERDRRNITVDVVGISYALM